MDLNMECEFSDDPIDGSASAPDRLRRAQFLSMVATSVDSLATRRSSSVIGLVGPWGSGKTSIIKLLIMELDQPKTNRASPSWTVVEFNPWFFQDLSSLQWGFLSALANGVTPGKKRAREIRAAVSELGAAIAPLGSIASFVGVNLAPAINTASKLIGARQTPDKRQSELNKLLSNGSKPVLIVLDDLDRLSPDELLLVFKLIRLVGRLPFVHYLIAYDEDTLLDVLTRTGLVGDDPNRASAYLEKMIQLRVDVPPLRQTQIDALVDEQLTRMAENVGLEMDRKQNERFSTAYELYLRKHLATPRAIKRYVAQVTATFLSVGSEVDPCDFLLVSCAGNPLVKL